jgi:hypothetical protein
MKMIDQKVQKTERYQTLESIAVARERERLPVNVANPKTRLNRRGRSRVEKEVVDVYVFVFTAASK